MSDTCIHIIPAEIGTVPDRAKCQSAVAYFRSIAPLADEISALISDRLEFVDCGANFEKIRCPSCGTEIEPALWQDWMGQDYGEKGFTLTPHPMPCCGARSTLHDLAYEWPQGFSYSRVCATNPCIGKLSDEQRSRFETLLGCSVRVIYQHL